MRSFSDTELDKSAQKRLNRPAPHCPRQSSSWHGERRRAGMPATVPAEHSGAPAMVFRIGLPKWKLEPGYDSGSGAGVFKDILKDLKNIGAELARHGLDLSALEAAAFSASPAVPVSAAVEITAGDAMTVTGFPADRANLSHAGQVLGVALNGAAPGELVMVQQLGLVTVTGFVLGQRLYVGLAGALSAVPPSSGFQQQVAIALGPSAVVVSLAEPIILAA